MTTEAATKLAPFGVEHVKSVCRDILFPDNMTPDETADLRWGFRLNSLDFTSHGEYRWPFPGHWAEASGPFTQLPSVCPSAEGDGICIAKTISGAQSGSGRFGKSTGLLVAYLPADLLAEETDKLRVKRAWVADVFDPVRALTLSGATSPGPTSPGPTSPGPTSPGPTSPGPTSPGPTSPGPTSPGPTSPGPTSPGPTSPGPTSTGPTSPGPTSTGPTSPGPTSPGPTSPGPTSPGPTSPGPTSPGPTSPGPTSPGHLWANLSGASYDQLTLWPEGFDVAKSAAVHGRARD